MILMLDNYDSFTFNLVQYLMELGVEVKVARNDEISVDEIAALAPSHIVVSPGPCTPNQAGVSLDVVWRFAGKIPLFGVCLGHQAIGQFFDGLFKAGVTGHTLEVVRVMEDGDEIVSASRWSAKGGDGSEIGGIATHVFTKADDGSLKLALHTFN